MGSSNECKGQGSAVRGWAVAGSSGYASGVLVDGLLYGLDSYKLLQHNHAANRLSGGGAGQAFRLLHRGFVPVTASGGPLALLVFFSSYEATKHTLKKAAWMPVSLVDLAASGLCAIPASVAGIPSDVLKKRMVLTSSAADPSFVAAMRAATRRGIGGLFVGWQANLIKDVPFAAVKVALYENFRRRLATHLGLSGAEALSPVQSAGVGMASGIVTAVITNPLDVSNTLLKSGLGAAGGIPPPSSLVGAHMQLFQHAGVRGLFRGVVTRMSIVGVGGMCFWPLYNGIKTRLDQQAAALG